MPELPEVETVRRTLNELVIGKQIDHVSVHLNRIIIKPEEVGEFCIQLAGQTILSVERRGKFLRFLLDDYSLVSHLRMEGRYGLYDSSDPLELHTHVVFHFTDGSELRYKDVRQFGTMHLFPKGRELEEAAAQKARSGAFGRGIRSGCVSGKDCPSFHENKAAAAQSGIHRRNREYICG